jgi:uncharacterized protein YchJ
VRTKPRTRFSAQCVKKYLQEKATQKQSSTNIRLRLAEIVLEETDFMFKAALKFSDYFVTKFQ